MNRFEFLFKRKLSGLKVEQYTEEKEIIYRNECLTHDIKLALGAIKLLNYLNSQEIPIAITTASRKTNVCVFIDKLNLLDYFSVKNIIYNDGKIKGNSHPDIFHKATSKLGVNKLETIIFEDSFCGIQAAINCKVENVVIINSTNEDYLNFDLPIITHFDEFDQKLLTRSDY